MTVTWRLWQVRSCSVCWWRWYSSTWQRWWPAAYVRRLWTLVFRTGRCASTLDAPRQPTSACRTMQTSSEQLGISYILPHLYAITRRRAMQNDCRRDMLKSWGLSNKQASYWHDKGFTPWHAIWRANEGRTRESAWGCVAVSWRTFWNHIMSYLFDWHNST